MERQIYQLNDENTENLVQAIEEQTSKLASIKGIDVQKKTRKKTKQSIDKDRQIYQQKKNNNERIVEAIKDNTEVLVQVVQPQEIPEVDLSGYFTKEEVQVITDDILKQLSESIKVENHYVHTENTIEPDYSKIEEFVKLEVSKIPKPKDGVDGVSPIVDINQIIITVLEQIPKQETIVVDYERIEEYCAETILRMERSRPRMLNSAGPTTRLAEISDVDGQNAVDGQVLTKQGNGYVFRDISDIAAVWGSVTGDITNQTDLVTYISDQLTTQNDLQEITDNGATTTNVITVKAQPTFTYAAGNLTNVTYDNTTEKDITYNIDGTIDTLTVTYPDSSTVVKTFNWTAGVLNSITIT